MRKICDMGLVWVRYGSGMAAIWEHDDRFRETPAAIQGMVISIPRCGGDVNHDCGGGIVHILGSGPY